MAGKKFQVFCSECGMRLSDSIYPPALSRKPRGYRLTVDNPNRAIMPKKYVCYDCSVMQAMDAFNARVERAAV